MARSTTSAMVVRRPGIGVSLQAVGGICALEPSLQRIPEGGDDRRTDRPAGTTTPVEVSSTILAASLGPPSAMIGRPEARYSNSLPVASPTFVEVTRINATRCALQSDCVAHAAAGRGTRRCPPAPDPRTARTSSRAEPCRQAAAEHAHADPGSRTVSDAQRRRQPAGVSAPAATEAPGVHEVERDRAGARRAARPRLQARVRVPGIRDQGRRSPQAAPQVLGDRTGRATRASALGRPGAPAGHRGDVARRSGMAGLSGSNRQPSRRSAIHAGRSAPRPRPARCTESGGELVITQSTRVSEGVAGRRRRRTGPSWRRRSPGQGCG